MNNQTEHLQNFIYELCQLPKETEWVEFKHNNCKPDDIGQYISALSNAAAICNRSKAYLVWGIDDNHKIVGTTFKPSKTKTKNQELENWLLTQLQPQVDIRFIEFAIDSCPISIIEIPSATHRPVQFKNNEYIRVGSYKKKLKDHPEKERTLWRMFDDTPFEQQIAIEAIDSAKTLRLFDYSSYFNLLNLPKPENENAILERLSNDGMIQQRHNDHWDILNLGAILFASDISRFKHLSRKAIRIVQYKGKGRTNTEHEQQGGKGYAAGFEGLINYLNKVLPQSEMIVNGRRKSVPMYPELAIRELVANVLIHQDFAVTGAGPMIEIFDSRLEITNPGTPLIDTERLLDSAPKSRNERLASFFRRIGICEERGSGIDKVVFQTEYYQLPAPLFEVTGEQTRATLFSHKEFSKMDKHDRIRATYLHACLQYVQRERMNNTSLRGRFGLEESSSTRSKVSRIIKETIDSGLIRQYDPGSESRRNITYVPYWS